MRTIVGDLWAQLGWKVIPTNLAFNKNGLAIMGRGVAAQAAEQVPHLKEEYGLFLQKNHKPELYFFPPVRLIMLPVKWRWNEKADLNMIQKGCEDLMKLSPSQFLAVNLPLIGCGFGELSENIVRPILERTLDDRFTLVLRNEETTKRYAKTFTPGARRDNSSVR